LAVIPQSLILYFHTFFHHIFHYFPFPSLNLLFSLDRLYLKIARCRSSQQPSGKSQRAPARTQKMCPQPRSSRKRPISQHSSVHRVVPPLLIRPSPRVSPLRAVARRPRFGCQPSRANRASSTGRTGVANGAYGALPYGRTGRIPDVYISFSLRQSLQNKTVASIHSMYTCLLRATRLRPLASPSKTHHPPPLSLSSEIPQPHQRLERPRTLCCKKRDQIIAVRRETYPFPKNRQKI